jgi:hypothetical protein
MGRERGKRESGREKKKTEKVCVREKGSKGEREKEKVRERKGNSDG